MPIYKRHNINTRLTYTFIQDISAIFIAVEFKYNKSLNIIFLIQLTVEFNNTGGVT